jgi:hypothetical protein
MAVRDLRGFYGCSDGGRSRLVSVGAKSEKVALARQTRFVADCPACGRQHPIEVAWRAAAASDRSPELIVEP